MGPQGPLRVQQGPLVHWRRLCSQKASFSKGNLTVTLNCSVKTENCLHTGDVPTGEDGPSARHARREKAPSMSGDPDTPQAGVPTLGSLGGLLSPCTQAPPPGILSSCTRGPSPGIPGSRPAAAPQPTQSPTMPSAPPPDLDTRWPCLLSLCPGCGPSQTTGAAPSLAQGGCWVLRGVGDLQPRYPDSAGLAGVGLRPLNATDVCTHTGTHSHPCT